MTREETRQAAEVLLAYANGKRIESAIKGGDGWSVNENPHWDFETYEYRIAPDQEELKMKHYRPYTMEEFVEDMAIHEPLIKIEDAVRKQYVLPTCITTNGVVLNKKLVEYDTLATMFYCWQDGARCRKEAEE